MLSLTLHAKLTDGSTLPEDLRRRISWEIASEYRFNCRIGRTPEKTGCSVAFVGREQLQSAVVKVLDVLHNESAG